MKPTRLHLNEAALNIAKLLGMITRMTDDEIDQIMNHDEVEALAKIAHDLHVCAAAEQTTKDALVLCPYCGYTVFPGDILECPKCGRLGCCIKEGGCMPYGRACFCPECEERQ